MLRNFSRLSTQKVSSGVFTSNFTRNYCSKHPKVIKNDSETFVDDTKIIISRPALKNLLFKHKKKVLFTCGVSTIYLFRHTIASIGFVLLIIVTNSFNQV